MRSLRSAASLLAAASTTESLGDITSSLGFAVPRALDPAAVAALGLPSNRSAPRVARGPGVLRALLLELPAGSSLRDTASLIANRVSSRAPHLNWLLALTERDGHGVLLAAWCPRARADSDHRSPSGAPRVVALAADRRHIVDSDAETLCALAAAAGGDDGVTHARWLDVLGRESLTRRFYRALQRRVHELGDSASGEAPPRRGASSRCCASRACSSSRSSRRRDGSMRIAVGWSANSPPSRAATASTAVCSSRCSSGHSTRRCGDARRRRGRWDAFPS